MVCSFLLVGFLQVYGVVYQFVVTYWCLTGFKLVKVKSVIIGLVIGVQHILRKNESLV